MRIEGKKEALLRFVAGMTDEQVALLVDALAGAVDRVEEARRARLARLLEETSDEEVSGYGRDIH